MSEIPLAARAVSPVMPAARLRGLERVIVPFATFVNTTPWAKRLIMVFVKGFSRRWVGAVARPRWEIHGLEEIAALPPGQSAILVSNHRSFFDMYVTCALLYERASFLDKLYFPVRSPFFYTNALGWLVNFGISGCAMWPPVFIDERRHTLNPIGLAQMARLLREPGNTIGIHPEGTRGKGDDPYQLLPAKPGVGHLVLAAPPDALVIPFFLVGPTNSVGAELRAWWRRDGPPYRIRFGSPLRAGALAGVGDAQQIADHLQAIVRALGEADRPKERP